MIRKPWTSAFARFGLAGLLALMLVAEGAAQQSDKDNGFWSRNQDAILVAVIAAVVGSFLTLLISEPVKALLKKLGQRLDRWLASHGWRFERRYLKALAERHQWLQLIGVYSRADLQPPRLREVFVSLRMAAGRAEDCPRVPWSDAFAPSRPGSSCKSRPRLVWNRL